jgi:hypothetical protein
MYVPYTVFLEINSKQALIVTAYQGTLELRDCGVAPCRARPNREPSLH